MKKSSFHFFNGLFIVVAGVVGVATIATTFQVLARESAGTQRKATPYVGAELVAMKLSVKHSSGYTRGEEVVWKANKWQKNGTKKLGFIVLGEQALGVQVNALAEKSTKSIEYAFHSAVIADKSKLPLTFAYNNETFDIATHATAWSADPQFALDLTPEMAGKWIVVYAMVRDNDNIAGLGGYPNAIDSMGALIMQVPEKLALAAQAGPAAQALAFSVPSFWQGVVHPKYPAKADNVIGYFTVSSQADKPIELKKVQFTLVTSAPFNSTIALVRVPQGTAAAVPTLFGAGDPANMAAAATVGLGKVPTTLQAGGGYAGDVTFPLAKNVVINPQSSITFAVTADNVNAMQLSENGTITMNHLITGVAWRAVGSNVDPAPDIAVAGSSGQQIFTPVVLSLGNAAQAPAGVKEKGAETVVGMFTLASKPTGGPYSAHISKLLVQLGSSIAFDADAKLQIALGWPNNVVASVSAADVVTATMKGSGLEIPLNVPLALASGLSNQIYITADTTNAVSGQGIQVGISGVWYSLDQAGSLFDDSLAVIGKKISF